MKKIDFLSTLFIGIDVSSSSNVVCVIDFNSTKHLQFSVSNNHIGAVKIVETLVSFLHKNKFKYLFIALESTSFYSIHIANFLSSEERLLAFNPYVYCLNPKMISNYRKSFIGMSKTDPLDAFIIADFARVGRINTQPWRGSQFLALQRLTRHRLHLVDSLTREKTYMVSNIFLKFSEFSVLKEEEHPFCSNYGSTAAAVLTEFLSTEDIVNIPVEELVDFICKKGKNRFSDPLHTATLLQEAARNSYRLDKCLYEPLTISIASSFNCIKAYETEIKALNTAIEKTIKGINTTEYQSLLSIPGIGPVYASGILAEIGSVSAFNSQDALAKYSGLTWTQHQSGNYSADDTQMSKAGNSYLRYYLIEAANSVKNNIPEYSAFYHKKFNEVKTHQHKRALALTSRKLIRLIFGLLANNQLYSAKRVNTTE
ncbi:MAG: IS110 family transposase [Clostridiaceae bacterium]|nr:IS110 family transposase [Clostridiaceae bacterium]